MRDKLISEYPNLHVEIEELGPTLRLFGSKDFLRDALPRAEELVTDLRFDIEVKPVPAVECTASAEIKPTRNVDEPVTSSWTPVARDNRSVTLLCITAESHDHDWGEYPALNPRPFDR